MTRRPALIAGGHTFGKAHGAADASKYVGPKPEGASIEKQGFGWKNTFSSGKGAHAISSGLQGAWTTNPVKWDTNYFENPKTGGGAAVGSGAVADADCPREDGSHRRHARPEYEFRSAQTRRLHQPAGDTDE